VAGYHFGREAAADFLEENYLTALGPRTRITDWTVLLELRRKQRISHSLQQLFIYFVKKYFLNHKQFL
jgi:hypothetical protein